MVSGMRQLILLIAGVGVAAGVVIALGTWILPEPPQSLVAEGAATEGLPAPDDLTSAGAVVDASGPPVDSGVVDPRYEIGGGWFVDDSFFGGPTPDFTEVLFGRSGLLNLRIKWEWVGGEVGGPIELTEVRLHVPDGGFFYARGDECQVELSGFEVYQRTQWYWVGPEEDDFEEVPHDAASVSGNVTCQGVVGIRMEEPMPLSYRAVFSVPMVDDEEIPGP